MIIIYVEENPEMIRVRMDEFLHSIPTKNLIKGRMSRMVELKTGIKFMFFTVKDIKNGRIRGLNISCAFINCYVDQNIRHRITYQLRGN